MLGRSNKAVLFRRLHEYNREDMSNAHYPNHFGELETTSNNSERSRDALDMFLDNLQLFWAPVLKAKVSKLCVLGPALAPTACSRVHAMCVLCAFACLTDAYMLSQNS